jgi:hypothetical protein
MIGPMVIRYSVLLCVFYYIWINQSFKSQSIS